MALTQQGLSPLTTIALWPFSGSQALKQFMESHGGGRGDALIELYSNAEATTIGLEKVQQLSLAECQHVVDFLFQVLSIQ